MLKMKRPQQLGRDGGRQTSVHAGPRGGRAGTQRYTVKHERIKETSFTTHPFSTMKAVMPRAPLLGSVEA
jgi:hypothetical protein